VSRGLAAYFLAIWVVAATGCGMKEQEKRDWVGRVIKETPRVAQLLFQLPEPPKNPYSKTGRYPDWIGDVSYEKFAWTKEGDAGSAEAVASVSPGPGLQGHPAAVRVELAVSFSVRETPPPIIFLPSGKTLVPSRWTIHRVDGRSVEESGGFQSYLEN
jgi:hypothetical protein